MADLADEPAESGGEAHWPTDIVGSWWCAKEVLGYEHHVLSCI